MKDFLLITDELNQYGVDINVVDGWAEEVTYEQNTNDQRASVCAYMGRGTIPGNLDLGIEFDMLYSGEKSIVDVDNQIRQMIENYAKPDITASDNSITEGYNPVYYKEKEGDPVAIQILKVGV